MEFLERTLLDVEQLLRDVKPAAAEKQMAGLIHSLDPESLSMHGESIRKTISSFFPKRRKRLMAILEQKTGPLKPVDETTLSRFDVDLRSRLEELSQWHIFQWATFYRETVSQVMNEAMELGGRSSNPDRLADVLRQAFQSHAHEVYAKGFHHVTMRARVDAHEAQLKSVSGLQRFLELPIEVYSDLALPANSKGEARVLRWLVSAVLTGILCGYGDVQFGTHRGWQLLPRYPRSWAHYVVFLRHEDLELLASQMEAGEFQEGLMSSVMPLQQALDVLAEKSLGGNPVIPTIGQFLWNARRLEVSIPLPAATGQKGYIEVLSFLNSGYVGRRDLEEAANRAVDLVLAPLRPDLRDWAMGHDLLRPIIVDTSPSSTQSSQGPAGRVLDILNFQLASRVSAVGAAAPLTYNIAKGFPLNNPFVAQYFRVQRKSVQDLLKLCETQNGIRLWCSVRRSGKTTACVDLGTATGTATIITQTCENTDQTTDASAFYLLFDKALQAGSPIEPSFFADAIDALLPAQAQGESRVVFVLDEYETLFERMQLAAMRDRELRYAIVQPLLNQMVAFSRRNLLVFIGQRPDAHYIIMDQNQLSPYVEQDVFPLFPHAPGALQSEFRQLIRKVVTDRVSFDDGFADALYEETSGHPFLTVNVLVDFFEWLIEERRPANSLALSRYDFERFASAHLTDTALMKSSRYGFFRQVIAEALGGHARKEMPWLHLIYSLIRRISEADPNEMRCSLESFGQHVEDVEADMYGYSEHDLLRTGSMANFLSVAEDEVRPRIKVVGRLS